jgi:hypothetical protein
MPSRFTFAVNAVLAVAAISAAPRAEAQTPPNLTATPTAHDTVALDWDDISGVTEIGYKILRQPTGGSYVTVTEYLGSPPTTAYTDAATLNEATGYRYKVAGLCGSPSYYYNCGAPAQVDVTTRLKAPTSLTATPDNDDGASHVEVALAWNDESGSETGYRIERRFDWEESFALVETAAASAEAATDDRASGALDWARATYRVQATSSTNASNWVEVGATTTWGKTNGEWCASLAVRPEAIFQSGSGCTPRYTKADLADDIDVVMMGSAFVTANTPSPSIPTWGDGDCRTTYWASTGTDLDDTHASHAAFIDSVLAEEDSGAEPTRFVFQNRMDLVAHRLLADPDFDADWLIDTTTSYSTLTNFFNNDTSADCTSPNTCSWHEIAPLYTTNGAWTNKWLRHLIDAAGSANDYQSKVYYLAQGGTSGGNPIRQHYPTAVIADQTNADYRAFRVDEAAAAVTAGHWHFIELNHKLSQYRPPNQHWLGASDAENVTEYNDLGDNKFSAQPDGYGYPQYVTGWSDLAADMDAADVPRSVNVSPTIWPRNAANNAVEVGGPIESAFDDASTSTVNEAQVLRDAIYAADLVILERRYNCCPNVPESAFLDVVEDIRGNGAEVFVVEPNVSACASP